MTTTDVLRTPTPAVLPEGVCAAEKPSCAPAPSPPVIVFDWDDTLFPTTWIQSWVGDVLHPVHVPVCVTQAMTRLTRDLLTLLNVAIGLGRVVIVTAAQDGWVDSCLSRFLPDVLPVVQSSVTVISARSTFEPTLGVDPVAWKVAAMRGLFTDTPSLPLNLISVGDSDVERCAAIQVHCTAPEHSLAKTIKTVDRPLCSVLRSQLQQLSNALPSLAEAAQSSHIVVQLPG